MRKWLASKTTSNEQEVALKKDLWAQKALRTFYNNQVKVLGNATVCGQEEPIFYFFSLSSFPPQGLTLNRFLSWRRSSKKTL